MNQEVYQALKNVLEKTNIMSGKLRHKRENQEEIWFFSTLLRDISKVYSWIDEVAKEYDEK
jgi:hypothetical protein